MYLKIFLGISKYFPVGSVHNETKEGTQLSYINQLFGQMHHIKLQMTIIIAGITQ